MLSKITDVDSKKHPMIIINHGNHSDRKLIIYIGII